MASLLSIQGNFKSRYGRWIEPLPDEHTLADFGDFIPVEARPGLNYNFPVLTAVEHGQTADGGAQAGGAFNLNPAIDSRVLSATLTGSTILLQSVVSYDVIYQSLNGTGSGNTGGAFKTALDQAVQAMLMGAGLYRELALAYGPGPTTTLAANIGVIQASISGTDLSTPGQVVSLTQASWIPGLWILAQNMSVDVYQSNGLTLRASNITVTARPSPSLSRLQLVSNGALSTNPTATVAVGDVITPRGWNSKSCVGLEAIYNNATTLFGIDASAVAPWRCPVFSAGGTLTRAKIMSYAAIISINGCKNGGKLFVSAPTFAALAEEFNSIMTPAGSGIGAVTTYSGDSNSRRKEIGSSNIAYVTAAGVIEVVVYQYAKQGQAFFIANDNFRRVGSTDLTMRPIGGGAEAFFTHLTGQAGAQMKIFSNQAPVFEIPYRNFLINGIVNTGYDVPPS